MFDLTAPAYSVRGSGDLDRVQVLVEIGFHLVGQQPAVVGGPAEGEIISAGTFLQETSRLRGLTPPARWNLLNVNIESARVLAVGAESDLFAVMAPAAESVDRFGFPREILIHPTIAQAMIGVAADTVQVVKLRTLIS